MDRFGAQPRAPGSYMVAAAFIVLLGLSTATPWLLVLAVFGAGYRAPAVRRSASTRFSAAYYPTSSRATGVSWANAVGRTGSVVGSMVGGYLLQHRLERSPRCSPWRPFPHWWPAWRSSPRGGCRRPLQRLLSCRWRHGEPPPRAMSGEATPGVLGLCGGRAGARSVPPLESARRSTLFEHRAAACMRLANPRQHRIGRNDHADAR